MSDASVTQAATTPPADPVPTPPLATHDSGAGSAEVPAPKQAFADFPVEEAVKRAIAELGYVHATEVQASVIAPALAGRDMLVQSKTGSGKTSAFGVPLIARLRAGSGQHGRPRALVLLPTRELAHQVAEELKKLGKYKLVSVQAIYGGVPLGKQTSQLQQGLDVVVGTPGRLLDHIRRHNLDLSEVETIVLDEADEMLSMGFWDDVTELIRLTPKTRQTLLFSATLPYEVAKSAQHLLRDVVRLDLSGDDLTVSGIDNCIVHVRPELPQPRQLLYVLEGARADNAIIFCNTRNETELLAKYLTQSGFVAEPLSGSFKQKEREKTMARIKSGELRYMVATDIAARGIDIADLTHVFNYALPEFCEVYLHRVGRTGRAGKVGKAISLVDGKGLGTLTVLEREFGIAFTEMTLPPEDEVMRARSERIMKELRDKAQMAELAQHLPVAQDIVDGENAAQMVAFLLKAYFNGQAAPKPMTSDAARDDDEDGEPDTAPRSRVTSAGRAPSVAPSRLKATDEVAGGEGGRRRRGRQNAGDDAAGAPHAPTPEGAEASAPRRGRAVQGRAGFDIVDASEMLRMPAIPERGGAQTSAERPAPERVPSERKPAERTPPERATRRGPAPRATGPAVARVNTVAPAQASRPKTPAAPQPAAPLPPGMCRLRVNIGFDDGFKGRGAVAKKVCALAGLNEGIVTELESRRDHAVLAAKTEVVEMVRERVDGARLGKKLLTLDVLA